VEAFVPVDEEVTLENLGDIEIPEEALAPPKEYFEVTVGNPKGQFELEVLRLGAGSEDHALVPIKRDRFVLSSGESTSPFVSVFSALCDLDSKVMPFNGSIPKSKATKKVILKFDDHSEEIIGVFEDYQNIFSWRGRLFFFCLLLMQ